MSKISSSCCCFIALEQLRCPRRDPRRRNSQLLSSVIRHRMLSTRKSENQDIHSLLLCPDPSRRLERSYGSPKPLGHGGFGHVYRMRHRMSGDIRAIKVIKKPSDSSEELQSISNEVYALLQLDHPNIAKLFEYFEDRQAIYVVTELCTGGNIGELDAQVDDWDEIRLLFRDVVRAIAYCHSEGIAHRDLKFDNCLITDCSERRCGRMAKVIDFGLAGFAKGAEGGTMNEVVGTLYFLAPEVLKSQDPMNRYGLECDLWSLGVMLFVVLTNEHPFCSTAAGPADAYRRISNGALRVSCLRNCGALAIESEDLLRSLLVKEPLNRCTAAEALLHPWLQPAGESPHHGKTEPRTEKLDSLVERILSFSRFSRFEQAILTVAAHEARPRDVEELMEVYSILDVTQAGYISRDDFRRALKVSDVRMSKMETDAVLDSLDPDKDAKIQLTDFLAATLKPSHVKSEKVLEELFNFFDFHGTGLISHEDLKQVLGQELACHVAVQARADAQGVISKDNFKVFLLKAMDKLELQIQNEKSLAAMMVIK